MPPGPAAHPAQVAAPAEDPAAGREGQPAGVPAPARAAILAWFAERGRVFPFRGVRDPYAILVNEAMSQQTQIARAAERSSRFLERFPTVEHLARAAPATVLREWRGLGYNRRALHLHQAARVIVAEHGGQVPDAVAALERLPGVGPYTARAVAALAFGRPVGAVDTNVRRVLGRMLGAADRPPGQLQAAADASVDPDRPADWTHALMDLAAILCRPSRPGCAGCPARPWCAFAADPSQPAPTARRTRGPAFRNTSRWLRGRLLDRLRDAAGDEWVRLEQVLGEHGPPAVELALAALHREGLIERHPTDPLRARLPLA